MTLRMPQPPSPRWSVLDDVWGQEFVTRVRTGGDQAIVRSLWDNIGASPQDLERLRAEIEEAMGAQ